MQIQENWSDLIDWKGGYMNDISKLITDEKYNLELKEQVSFEEPKKYLKAVSSFANRI